MEEKNIKGLSKIASSIKPNQRTEQQFYETQLKNKVFLLIKPAPFAAIMSGLLALSAAPNNAWGMAAAITTGIITGYGARWGRSTASPLGLMTKAGQQRKADLVSKGDTADLSDLSRLFGVGHPGTFVWWAASIAGYVGGATMTYNVAQKPINEFVTNYVEKQFSLVVPAEPTRGKDIVKKDGVRYQLVFKNG